MSKTNKEERKMKMKTNKLEGEKKKYKRKETFLPIILLTMLDEYHIKKAKQRLEIK